MSNEQPTFTKENLLDVESQGWSTRQAAEFMRVLVGLPREGTPPYWHVCEAVKKALSTYDLLHIKLASIVVHAQELLSPDGREADKQALLPLLEDPHVVRWLNSFDKVLLPVKRVK